MAAPIVRTKTPGIFKRGSRYTFSYRINGKQKWETAGSLDEALANKARRRGMRENPEAQRIIDRAQRTKLAESRQTAEEAYSLVRRAMQALERAERLTASRDARAAYRETWRPFYEVEEALTRGLKSAER